MINSFHFVEMMQNVESNIFWFVDVYVTHVAISVQICENCCHLLAHVSYSSCVLVHSYAVISFDYLFGFVTVGNISCEV